MLKLRLIREGRWRLYAVCTSRGECPLLDFLTDSRSLWKDKVRTARRLEAMAEHGSEYLPDISHQIEPGIWQTEQGRIRILWFYDEGRVIVCSHAFIKKTKKTPEREKTAAREAREAYAAARSAGALEIIGD